MAGRTMHERIKEMLVNRFHVALPKEGYVEIVNRKDNQTYRVYVDERRCTCPAWRRGEDCKHIMGLVPLLRTTHQILQEEQKDFSRYTEYKAYQEVGQQAHCAWRLHCQLEKQNRGYGEYFCSYQAGDLYKGKISDAKFGRGSFVVVWDDLHCGYLVVSLLGNVVFTGSESECNERKKNEIGRAHV